MGRSKRVDGSNLSSETLDSLRSSIKGKVVVKGQSPEEEYRPLLERWNRMHIKEANIIVLPESEEDVSSTVKFVAEHNLDVAIASGRHTYSGPSSGYGLIIDMRNLRKVSVDAEKMVAVAQGGSLAGDIESAAEAVGLRPVMGAVNATGCGGITTGGGIGNLSAQYGLVADNLLAARVALADGSIVVASEEENQDLFWGIRGGGSNFGLVTEFTYKLHKADPQVYSGFFMFPPDKVDAYLELMNVMHQDYVMKSNGKFACNGFTAIMGGNPIPGFLVWYDGPEEEGKKYIQPLLDLGPIYPGSGAEMKRHTETTDWKQFEKMFPPQFNRLVGTSTQISYPLSVDILKRTVQKFKEVVATRPESLSVSKLLFDLRDYSKVASVPLDATAYANRREGCLIAVDFIWDKEELDKEMMQVTKDFIAEVRDWIKQDNEQKGIADVGAHVAATTLYALVSDGDEKLVSVFGPNLGRMKELKKKYDPGMMWDKWYPVDPEV
ncbi:hypothetical protein TWF788_003309 [Orbilia oligospora]|uniref:FAD-binding PCMH-type domain-containing protein n=1 Tax=Orbilia oligospora TaxID=2813651 RepID=A0A6G1MN89_ORBOL|nr:hypothetical protein TWF788_003309 [Orbilia oligospora]KAF3209490.1 hypothetical protein TWF679_007315 [Orbilia oligospora]KAF3216229.1 hypothetical protein TWF191_009060 [Orbilia oligospora]KAF3264461.1 hypothetical protein TWF192_004143 [Orbilia oligospora]